MTDQFFYSTRISEDQIILPEDEAHHLIKVLRRKNGDSITVVDGKGGLYQASLEKENIQDCRLKILKHLPDFGRKNYYIHIGIAPPKSHDRLEWFVEKAVEIGVQEISFIQTQFSERTMVKSNRIFKRAVSSMKQSLKAYLPTINDMLSISDFMVNCNNAEKYVGYLGMETIPLLKQAAAPRGSYCVLIGPEGDFSPLEIKEAGDYGFQLISLGESRLRTETAGVVACHILNIINEK